MSDTTDLEARMNAVVAAAKDKAKTNQKAMLQDHLERQKSLKVYESVQDKIVETVKPKLEALAKRSGERVHVTPSVSQYRRTATFKFRSPKAYITLTFSIGPDREVKNAVVSRELRIVPVLWTFETHAETSTPVVSPDLAAVGKWVDDQIVSFVELFVQINESEVVEKAEMVEDPVAKVKFPKFAAGASLDHGGKTLYFIDATTKTEYAKQNNITST
jgi:YHS domain-containing protein